MKTLFRILIAVLSIVSAQAQTNPYSLNIVGYVNHGFTAGTSLFSNPLLAATNNYLSTIFQSANVPDGTSISLWNSTTRTFDTTSTFAAGSWSLNFSLNPGTGARLITPSAFTNTFIGTVLNHDGSLLTGDPSLPPVYSGPNGLFLLGDRAPITSSGNNIFLNLLGRAPNVGEQVLTLTTTSTYLGEGLWDSIPNLAVSDAVFLNIGPVPEPSVAALTMTGLVLLAFRTTRNR